MKTLLKSFIEQIDKFTASSSETKKTADTNPTDKTFSKLLNNFVRPEQTTLLRNASVSASTASVRSEEPTAPLTSPFIRGMSLSERGWLNPETSDRFYGLFLNPSLMHKIEDLINLDETGETELFSASGWSTPAYNKVSIVYGTVNTTLYGETLFTPDATGLFMRYYLSYSGMSTTLYMPLWLKRPVLANDGYGIIELDAGWQECVIDETWLRAEGLPPGKYSHMIGCVSIMDVSREIFEYSGNNMGTDVFDFDDIKDRFKCQTTYRTLPEEMKKMFSFAPFGGQYLDAVERVGQVEEKLNDSIGDLGTVITDEIACGSTVTSCVIDTSKTPDFGVLENESGGEHYYTTTSGNTTVESNLIEVIKSAAPIASGDLGDLVAFGLIERYRFQGSEPLGKDDALTDAIFNINGNMDEIIADLPLNSGYVNNQPTYFSCNLCDGITLDCGDSQLFGTADVQNVKILFLKNGDAVTPLWAAQAVNVTSNYIPTSFAAGWQNVDSAGKFTADMFDLKTCTDYIKATMLIGKSNDFTLNPIKYAHLLFLTATANKPVMYYEFSDEIIKNHMDFGIELANLTGWFLPQEDYNIPQFRVIKLYPDYKEFLNGCLTCTTERMRTVKEYVDYKVSSISSIIDEAEWKDVTLLSRKQV